MNKLVILHNQLLLNNVEPRFVLLVNTEISLLQSLFQLCSPFRVSVDIILVPLRQNLDVRIQKLFSSILLIKGVFFMESTRKFSYINEFGRNFTSSFA